MRPIGYSTGTLALDDWRTALEQLRGTKASVVELSALRERELEPLVNELSHLDLSHFDYVIVHAPSRLERLSERGLIDILRNVARLGYPIVVHPDTINDYDSWSEIQENLCIENMDKRKSKGQTIEDFLEIFDRLAGARLCFDIGHSRHVDRTLSQAVLFLQTFSDRLRLIHLSEVNYHGRHVALSYMALCSFAKLADLVPSDCPIVIESPVSYSRINVEIQRINDAFNSRNLTPDVAVS